MKLAIIILMWKTSTIILSILLLLCVLAFGYFGWIGRGFIRWGGKGIADKKREM